MDRRLHGKSIVWLQHPTTLPMHYQNKGWSESILAHKETQKSLAPRSNFTNGALRTNEYVKLQGWPDNWDFGSLQNNEGADEDNSGDDQKELLEALGNGMSFNVQEAIWSKVLPLLAEECHPAWPG